MATFYIQLENKLLQISGDLTTENISKALGYVPVSPNVTNELSQRVDNITFDGLKDNPFLQDGSGELNIVDEVGNIIAKINADGIHSVDFITGEHRLSDKTDKTYVDEAIKNVKVDLTGYATEEYVNNIDFYNINNNPIVNNGDGKLLFVDESGYIGLQLEEDGLYVKDVIADGHTLSQKADKSDLSNYATKDEVSDLVDMSVVTELQENVDFLVGEDSNKSIRTIANEELVKQLLEGNDNFQTLQELSAWINEHPESAAAMNEAIQKNSTDIINTLTTAKTYTNETIADIDFYSIKNNPIVNSGDGKLLFVDESGYIGLQLEEDGLYVKDVIADGHTLSQKADKSDIPSLNGYATESYVNTNLQNYATKDEVSDLVDMSIVTELQGKVNRLIDTDTDKSVRDIAVDVLTETLVSETATDAYDTLAEMSTWIKSHPESAAAMNEAIQKNTADIQSNVNTITDLDSAYKVADVKVLTDANEYTDNINFYTIKDNPIVDNNDDGNLIFVDESGNIGLQLEEDGLYVKDVIADGHTLSQKANKSDLSAYVTTDELEGYVKKEAIETYYLELPIDEETGQCLMSGSLTQEQFESISNCSVLIVRTAHVDSEEVLASEDITFNWKISQSEQYEGGSKAYAYSNLHPSIMEGCFVLYAIVFNQYEGVCSYELTKKRFVVDTEITDPTDAFISTNSVYELDLSSGTTAENGLIMGSITEEEFNQIAISKNIIVNTGLLKVSLTQKHTYINRLVFYGNIYYGISQRFVLTVVANGNEYSYMAQLVPIVYELDLSSGTTDENGRITGNITAEEFNQIIEAETLAIKLGDHKVSFNQKSTSDRQGEYLFYGIYNDYEKEKIVLLIVLHDNNDYVYEIRTQELGGSSAYPEVNHETSDTTFTLTPNTFHIWGEVSSLTLTIGSKISGIANEYLFQFTSGSEPTTLTLPDSIKFNSDFTVEANKIYQISILNGLGTVMSWSI